MSKGVAWEFFQSYRRGWRDGACATAKRREFMEHPTRHDLRDAYERGYNHGRVAADSDLRAEAERLWIDLSASVIDR